jgi:hypothetical protein
MPQHSDIRRILQLIEKKIYGSISPAEFDELNTWIYDASGLNTVVYEVLTNKLHGNGLKRVGQALLDKHGA